MHWDRCRLAKSISQRFFTIGLISLENFRSNSAKFMTFGYLSNGTLISMSTPDLMVDSMDVAARRVCAVWRGEPWGTGGVCWRWSAMRVSPKMCRVNCSYIGFNWGIPSWYIYWIKTVCWFVTGEKELLMLIGHWEVPGFFRPLGAFLQQNNHCVPFKNG